jgi:hypothetical protein
MATRIAGIARTDGVKVKDSDVVFADSGGTLDASNVVQVNYDDSVFGSTKAGQLKLAAALDVIVKRIQSAKVWPPTASA